MVKRGIFVGIVVGAFLVSGESAAQGGHPSARAAARPAQPDVRLVGPPTWWIVPFREGNTEEGKLYFGATVENRSDMAASVGLSFQSYTPEGTRFEGCYEMGGGGPGVYVEVAPRERAFLVCNRSIVPVSRTGLQVTTRLWDLRPVASEPTQAAAVETGIRVAEEYLDAIAYDGFARVRSLSGRDVEVSALLRFYAEDGTQVATCESRDVTIEPEVVQRVTCADPVLIVPGVPRPERVRAELRPARW